MITLDDLHLRAGSFRVERVSFDVPAGGYAVMMGRTGTGKTTILEAICGLNRPLGGRVILAGRDVTGLRPADRQVGYVPQDRALFTTMTVREHLAFGPTIRNWPWRETEERVEELADLLGLRPLLHRRPLGLSGGESQRVALGLLAARPAVLLMDEPLSALDDQSREEMYDLIRSVRDRTGVTTLHVTHHVEEADAWPTRCCCWRTARCAASHRRSCAADAARASRFGPQRTGASAGRSAPARTTRVGLEMRAPGVRSRTAGVATAVPYPGSPGGANDFESVRRVRHVPQPVHHFHQDVVGCAVPGRG